MKRSGRRDGDGGGPAPGADPSGPPSLPPRLIEAAVRLLLPDAWADDALGDLRERWQDRTGSGRRAIPLAWYLGQCLSLVLAGLGRPRDTADWAGALVRILAGEMASAARRIRRRPLPTVAASALLAPALAFLGAGTAAVADLLRPLEREDGAHVVVLGPATAPGGSDGGVGPALLEPVRDSVPELDAAGLFRLRAVNLRLGGTSAPPTLLRTNAGWVTPDALRILGVEAREGAAAGGRPVYVSRSLTVPGMEAGEDVLVDGVPHTVAGRYGPIEFPGYEPALLVPVAPDGAPFGRDAWTGVLGLLPPGTSPAGARRALGRIPAGALPPGGLALRSLVAWQVEDTGRTLALLTGVPLLLFVLVALGGAASLQHRRDRRRRELDLRRALGAGRARIVLQLHAEVVPRLGGAVLLGAAGAAVGARALASSGLLLPQRAFSAGLPWKATLIAGACGVVLMLGAPLVSLIGPRRCPAGVAPGAVPGPGHGPRRRPGPEAFLAGQAALATVLVAVALLLGRHLWVLGHADRGLDAAHLVTVGAVPTEEAGTTGWPEELLERMRTLDGVEDAAFASLLPGIAPAPPTQVELSGGGGYVAGTTVGHRFVSDGFFRTLGIPLLEGRPPASGSGAAEAVVNRRLAGALSPGGAPLGRTLRWNGRALRVVGVADNTVGDGPAHAPRPTLYLPHDLGTREARAGLVHFAVRTSGAPERVAERLAGMVRDGGIEATVFGTLPLDEGLARRERPYRMSFGLAALCSALGLATALGGVAGLVTCSVTRRRREVAVRRAVGAGRLDLAMELIAEACRAGLVGILVGTGVVAALLALQARLLPWAAPGVLPLVAPPLVASALILGAALAAARALARTDVARALQLG